MSNSRVLKFRAWNGERMVLSSSVEEMMFSDGHYYDYLPANYSPPIMQFTGLLDSEGTEIYEGDIIERSFPSIKNIRAVEWGRYADDEYVSTLECWMAGEWPVSDLGGRFSVGEHTNKVIGNIHENPELLEEA